MGMVGSLLSLESQRSSFERDTIMARWEKKNKMKRREKKQLYLLNVINKAILVQSNRRR